MMPCRQHHGMRTTITLDEDVAAKLVTQARRTGQSFKETVNETLRRGLASARLAPQRRPFTVVARDLGPLRLGLTLDSIANLLEHVEGPLHR